MLSTQFKDGSTQASDLIPIIRSRGHVQMETKIVQVLCHITDPRLLLHLWNFAIGRERAQRQLTFLHSPLSVPVWAEKCSTSSVAAEVVE